MRVYIESLTMSSQEPPKKKSKQVENKQGTLLSWVKPCTSDTEPGVVEETIRIKEHVMLATNAVGERSFSEPPHDVACSQGQNRCSGPCRRS